MVLHGASAATNCLSRQCRIFRPWNPGIITRKGPFRPYSGPNLNLSGLTDFRQRSPEEKRPTVFVPMSADLVHGGHLNILNVSKQYGRVVVGLVSDEGLKSYKREPILGYEDRLKVVQSFEQVDEVIRLEGIDFEIPLNTLRPEFMVHGSDWADPSSPQYIRRAESIKLMAKWGGKVIEPPYTEGISTSDIIARCSEEHAKVAAAKLSETASTASTRTLKDVWTLLPNQIDYARLLMGTAPVYLPHQFYMLSAGLYFTSHLLDQVDGKVARMLNQKSHFGVVLDYSVDIITGAVFMLKMCSLAAAPAYYIVPCSVVIAVETFGLVLAVNASAAGKYWKITDPKTPYVLRKIVMKDGKYTPLGHFSVVAHQAMVTCAWLMVFDPSGIWLGAMAALSPFASLNLWANSAIVYEMLRTWEEPAP